MRILNLAVAHCSPIFAHRSLLPYRECAEISGEGRKKTGGALCLDFSYYSGLRQEKEGGVFTKRAYQEGLCAGEQDALAGREKNPKPSKWKIFLSPGHYLPEYNRGYRVGFETVSRGQVMARQRTASIEERRAALVRNPTREREDELER